MNIVVSNSKRPYHEIREHWSERIPLYTEGVFSDLTSCKRLLIRTSYEQSASRSASVFTVDADATVAN